MTKIFPIGGLTTCALATVTVALLGTISGVAAQAPMPVAHVQLAVTDVSVPEQTPGECVLSATVLRDFTSPPALQEGTALTLPFDCHLTDEDVPDQAANWIQASKVAHARFLEAFLYPLGESLTIREDAFTDLRNVEPDALCGDLPPCEN